MRLTVGTYNVKGFRAGVGRVAAVVRDASPDLLLVQEAGRKRAFRRFCRELGMEFASSHRPFSRIRNAVAVRPPWTVVRAEAQRLPRLGRTIPRGFVTVVVRRETTRVTVVCVHLGLAPRERVEHARIITDTLAVASGPVVIGGDLNEGPEGDAARWIAERFFDVWSLLDVADAGETFPATVPTARIDYLFVNDLLRPVDAVVTGGDAVQRASDHRPVLADLELRPA